MLYISGVNFKNGKIMEQIEYKNCLIVKYNDGNVSAFYYADENETDDNIVETKCKTIKEAKGVINKHLKKFNKKC